MKNEKWLELPNEEQANIAKKDGYEIKKINGVWFFNKNKPVVNSTTGTIDPGIKLVENIIRKLLREAKQWLEVPQGEYNNKKNDPKFETKEENGKYYIKEKEDPNTNTGGGAAPVSALPKWVDSHACLKGAQPIAQGDNIIIEYQGQKFSLSSDQKAVDVNDSAFTGTWQCVTPTSLKIYTSAVRSSGNVVSGGDGGNKGGGSCTEDMFPDCVRGLKMAEEQCAIIGYAKTTDLREYQIRYLSQKAIGPDQMEQFRCWIYVNGWKGGYYTCGASGPIITSDIGQLYGTNKGSYSQISSKDRAGNVSRLNTIKDFIRVNDAGTQITDIDNTKLRQIVYEVQNLVRDGYRGAAIGELIEYLQEVEELLNTNFNQEKETITTALTDINNVVKNFKKEDFDPNYVVDLDPPSGVIASYETENPKFANTYLNKDFTVYRNPAFLNRASMDAGTSSAAGKVKEKGFNKESCKNYLENYLISIDLGRLVGRNDVTGYKDDEIIKLTPQWIAGIKKCANNNMYKRGILGNQDYQKAIDYLNNLPVEKGGIKL